MSEEIKEPIKKKYAIDKEKVEESIDIKMEEEEEQGTAEEVPEEEGAEEEKPKKGKSADNEQKKSEKNIQKKAIEDEVLKILSKGKVKSKTDLTNALVKAKIPNYSYRYNIEINELSYDYAELGGVLKNLRFSHKIKFAMKNGSHSFYIEKQKELKIKKEEPDFDWKKYQIPEGENEIYVVFKVPCQTVYHHFLTSCFPDALLEGFKIIVGKDYEKTNAFSIYGEKLNGFFDQDKLILKCKTSAKDAEKILYCLVQMGRKIIIEVLKLNMRYSEVLRIQNYYDTIFLPIYPVFRAKDKKAFFESKFHNVLRFFYDFPEKYEGKLIFGKFAAISKELKDENFALSDFYPMIEKSFELQTKSFISSSIMNDYIINPAKAYNYIAQDAELKKLIEEYEKDIDTEHIIKERLNESMEKNEKIKEITSNLLLTLLSLSFLANSPALQWIVIVCLVLINGYYLYIRSKKKKQKEF